VYFSDESAKVVDLTQKCWFVRVIQMFQPNFERELVEEESCERNILLREHEDKQNRRCRMGDAARQS